MGNETTHVLREVASYKVASQRLTARITARVSEAERAAIERKAQASGLTLSNWLRGKVL